MSLAKQQQNNLSGDIQRKPQDSTPHFHRHDNASIMIEAESQNESHRYREERDQEEYYYVHSRPQSEASESATMHFLTDDRLENNWEFKEYGYDTNESHQHQRDMSVDYSTKDFQHSRAIIDAAARTGANSVTQNDNSIEIHIHFIGNWMNYGNEKKIT
uniref:Uncharacterized protein n=1 Tax=Panagrolaimus superbus TaxID=310955 RepID=A0A914Z8R0_9BILA